MKSMALCEGYTISASDVIICPFVWMTSRVKPTVITQRAKIVVKNIIGEQQEVSCIEP